MAEESKLPVVRKDGDSSLALSSARPSLITRGRRDAVSLPLPSSPTPVDPFLSQKRAETLRRAEEGESSAQFWLGVFYLGGTAGPKDDNEAVKWLRLAVNQHYTPAQRVLGRMHTDGRGVAQDHAEAVRWFRKAADQGDPIAQTALGRAYADGRGVLQDYAEAVRWFRKAAEHGYSHAQASLSSMYAKGHGLIKDDAEAAHWLRKATDQSGIYNPAIGEEIVSLDEIAGWFYPQSDTPAT